jgi:hypothetical protein
MAFPPIPPSPQSGNQKDAITFHLKQLIAKLSTQPSLLPIDFEALWNEAEEIERLHKERSKR